MSGGTAWAIGAFVAGTAATIDAQKNAQHQARLVNEANQKQAEEALRIQEAANGIAAAAAAAQEEAMLTQAEEMRAGADAATKNAQESANQGALQRAQQTELDRQRRQAEEAARQAQKDASVQAPDVSLNPETTDTPRQRRKAFSSTASTVRI